MKIKCKLVERERDESESAKQLSETLRVAYLASKRDGATWHIAINQLHASRPDLLVLLASAGSCVYRHNLCCHIIVFVI